MVIYRRIFGFADGDLVLAAALLVMAVFDRARPNIRPPS
jgi:hypothetical protein